MTRWTLPHLYALLLGRGAPRWHWQLVESAPGEPPVRALVQDDGMGGTTLCGVFAMGETLSLQARVLAQVSPALLKEASERALLLEDAAERVQPLTELAQRLTQRAYQHKRSDEYSDLQRLRASLVVLQKLLASSAAPALDELIDWELQATQEALREQPPENPA